jgi:hypothetical protein
MNLYQLEVAELDRRRQVRTRAVSFFGAAAVMVVALWSAGLPPTEWISRTQDWFDQFGRSKEHTAPKPPAPMAEAQTMSGASVVPSTAALPGTDSSVSKVPLPLLLVSTSPGRNVTDGTANIGTDSSNPQTYSAGALLANGARLSEIHKNYVVLERSGKTVRLNLVGPEGAPVEVSNFLLTVGGVTESTPVIVPSHEVLTDYIRPNPVFDGELIRGYEVYAGQNAGVFSQLGLQGGDVIIALNDTPFTDPAQAMVLFHQITDGMAVMATVERKGKRERIPLDGALITADQERREQVSPAHCSAAAMLAANTQHPVPLPRYR